MGPKTIFVLRKGPQMLIFRDNAHGQDIRPRLGNDESGAWI